VAKLALKREKELQRQFDHWMNGFMQTYREVRSDKWEWQPNDETFSYVARFYAAVGDADAALQILNSYPNLTSKSKDTIALSLIQLGRLEEANTVLKDCKFIFPRAKIAYFLASKDEEKLKNEFILSKGSSVNGFQYHFGDSGRISLLKHIADEIQTEINPQFLEYIRNLE